MAEDTIETVTVTASRLPPWWLYAGLGLALLLSLRSLLK